MVSHVRFQREFKAKGFEGEFGIDFVHRDSLATFVSNTIEAFGTEVVPAVHTDAVIPKDKWPMWSDW